jgi:hypothetical protein
LSILNRQTREKKKEKKRKEKDDMGERESWN